MDTPKPLPGIMVAGSLLSALLGAAYAGMIGSLFHDRLALRLIDLFDTALPLGALGGGLGGLVVGALVGVALQRSLNASAPSAQLWRRGVGAAALACAGLAFIITLTVARDPLLWLIYALLPALIVFATFIYTLRRYLRLWQADA